jgi:hypothetical protein
MNSRPLANFVPAFPAIGLIGSQAIAQSTSWENLQQLRPGQTIQVVRKDLKSWTGAFVSASNDSVSLKAADGDKTVARTGVLRVSRHGGKRGPMP